MTVESFRFLGTTISHNLKWDTHIDSIVEKAEQRLHFILPDEEVQPGTGAAETVLLCHHWICALHIYNCLVQLSYQIWLQKVVRTAERIIGTTLPTLQELYLSRVSKRAGKITGPLISSALPLWTAAVWTMLQSSEHKNGQAQVQFLRSGNPSHKQLDNNCGTHTIYTRIHLFI